MKRIKHFKGIVYLLAVLFIAVLIVFFLKNLSNGSSYDTLAKCLTKNGATIYGTDWCPNCQNQKKIFGESFKLINYVNCDFNEKKCNDAHVTAYPTWFIKGKNYLGVQSIDNLAKYGMCRSGES